MRPGNENHISSGDRPISGDLDSLNGLQLTSNAQHTIHIVEQSWIPWIVFSDQWNAANAHNLALLSTLSYADQLADEKGFIPRTGEPGKGQAIADFFEQSLHAQESRSVPGTRSLPLLTRSVRRGDHFQDLRFWDAGVIQPDGPANTDPQAVAVRSRDHILRSGPTLPRC